ncbi:MAG: LysE family translocator [Pseudomonadota bacterium]|jgi:threonine/homoserine/homoserine lactone efflux protein
MTIVESLIAFSIAAGLLTITPGLDTALILRTAAVRGASAAWRAALGIGLGCLVWGAATALGVGALITASTLAFTVLKWVGAGYLVYLGAKALLKPRHAFDVEATEVKPGQGDSGQGDAFARGLLTNLLNPKVGVFYISFLPQFVPAGSAPALYMFGLAGLHVAMGLLWSAALILALRPLRAALQKPAVVAWLDRVTGGVFIGFGVRLALTEHA